MCIRDRDKMIDKTTMRPGDVVIGLASSGVHSNGFSLVRKVFENWDMAVPRPELGGKSLYEALIAPTRIYVKPVLALLEKVSVRGISHITGGGFYENVPRSIPQGLCARIRKDAVKTPAIFDLIAKAGSIPERDMFNTFNMGVGMTIVVQMCIRDRPKSGIPMSIRAIRRPRKNLRRSTRPTRCFPMRRSAPRTISTALTGLRRLRRCV